LRKEEGLNTPTGSSSSESSASNEDSDNSGSDAGKRQREEEREEEAEPDPDHPGDGPSNPQSGKGKGKTRQKGRQSTRKLYTDMYKMFDGSAIMALGEDITNLISLHPTHFFFGQECWFKNTLLTYSRHRYLQAVIKKSEIPVLNRRLARVPCIPVLSRQRKTMPLYLVLMNPTRVRTIMRQRKQNTKNPESRAAIPKKTSVIELQWIFCLNSFKRTRSVVRVCFSTTTGPTLEIFLPRKHPPM
jgi:hypothetical protein